MKKGKDLKPHIGIFGRRNNGKSSFINRLVGHEVAIVSNQAGTTTDPVKKSVEIFGVGPAIIIDTAGIDDSGDLGVKRIEKTLEVIKTIDCAILLIAGNKFGTYESELLDEFEKFEVPFQFLIDENLTTARKLNLVAENGLPYGLQLLGYDPDVILPTVLMLNKHGRIIYSDQTSNYRVRPEPGQFLEVARQRLQAVA